MVHSPLRPVQFQQPGEDFFVGEVGGPVVGGGDGGVQVAVGVGEPGGAGVVEVGEGALLEFGGGRGVHGDEAVGVAGDDLGLAADELGRVEPRLAQVVEAADRIGDSLSTLLG